MTPVRAVCECYRSLTTAQSASSGDRRRPFFAVSDAAPAEGDVGSGKTIVAALTIVLALESGLQAAFMAPTELLAEQHFANLQRLLGERYRLVLLSGGAGRSSADRKLLAHGEVHLAVGTHALIQEGVEFRRLGLAVIDEQHRFGVLQRQLLQRKGDHPDVLVMTATPIPRSLALTAYGDLESSVLDELPPGRTPIATEVQPVGQRRAVYQRLREEVAKGAQAYVASCSSRRASRSRPRSRRWGEGARPSRASSPARSSMAA